jgi:hypothetical protein
MGLELSQKFDKSEIKDKYTLSGNTFKTKKKDKYDIQTSIGEGSGSDFIPNMSINRWDNECSLKIIPQLSWLDKKDSSLSIEGNKIKLKLNDGKKEYHFYEIPEDGENPEGSYEFEVVLNQKPLTNIVEFDVEAKGLRFLPQPELTEIEKDSGCYRPTYLDNSWAIYHESKKGNIINGVNRKAGKFGHILQPKIRDALGNWVYGKLDINIISGKMTIEIPDDFMYSAVCPIFVDPTLGYTTVGGTNSGVGNDFIFGMWNGAATEDGSAVSVSTHCFVADDTPMTVGVYDNDGGGPNNLLRDSAEFTVSTAAFEWVTGTLDSALSITNGTTYWLAQNHGDRAITFKYDVNASKNTYLKADTYSAGSLVDPFPASPTFVGSREYSMYLTYNLIGGFSPWQHNIVDE